MKEMRKQRLSTNRFYGTSRLPIDGDDRSYSTTTPIPETTESSSSEPTELPLISDEMTTTTAMENDPDVPDDDKNDITTLETTTINDLLIKDPLKTSKFLRFEKEVLLNYSRVERKHQNNVSNGNLIETNSISR